MDARAGRGGAVDHALSRPLALGRHARLDYTCLPPLPVRSPSLMPHPLDRQALIPLTRAGRPPVRPCGALRGPGLARFAARSPLRAPLFDKCPVGRTSPSLFSDMSVMITAQLCAIRAAAAGHVRVSSP